MRKTEFTEDEAEDYEIFSKVARASDKLQSKFATLVSRNFRTNAVSPNILDIGCGSGLTAIKVKEKIKSGKYILNDIDKNILNIAGTKKELADVRLNNQDIFDLLQNIEKEKYDLIFSAFTIHNFTKPRRSKLFKEIKRVLKKDGVFAYIDIIGNKSEARNEQLAKLLVNTSKIYTKYRKINLYLSWVKRVLLDESDTYIFSDKENSELIKKCKFKIITSLDLGREKIFILGK